MKAKIAIIVVCVILVVISICAVFFNKKDNLEENNNVTNTELKNNVNETNTENGVEENTINNEIVENQEQIKTEPNTGTSVVPSSAIYESNSDVGTTDKKQEAINLVKNYWGEDSDATYRCDYVDSNGEYIIAVSSIQTASVKGYFRVNLEKKSVDIEY